MKSLKVELKEDGKKLNTFVTSRFPHLKQSAFQKALRKKDIRINGKRVNENVILHAEDEVTIYLSDDVLDGTVLSRSDSFQPFDEDEYIAVYCKPAGIETEGKGSFSENLQQINPNQYLEPCHRLDRNTSGLILYAKSPEARQILFTKFKKREIEKHYLATVLGIPNKKAATLIDYLFKDAKKSQVYISHTPKPGYVKIITQYTLVSSDTKTNTSVLDVQIHTGRTHQIRAHLAFIGYPILGDGKYGDARANKQFHKSTQDLISYSLHFAFSTDSGILNYLNGKTIQISA